MLPRRTLEQAAKKFGTPLYVYDAALIRSRVSEYDAAFSAIPHLVCFALKSNPNAGVSRLLAREGAGADVVSGGELWRALRAGFAPRRIVFSGVGKTAEEVASALRSGILMLNAESSEEIDLLARVGGRLGKKVPLGIRVNPGIKAGGHSHIETASPDSKFGVPEREAAELYKRAARTGKFDIIGVHSHLGSQIRDVEPYRRSLTQLLKLADGLKSDGIRLRYLDIGGGWAVSDDGRPRPPVSTLAKGLLPMLKGRAMTLLLEPGRYLVAEAGVLLTKVLFRKTAGGRRYVVVDAAMNDLIRPALYDARHPAVLLGPSDGGPASFDVVGPVCESGDFLARGVRMRQPKQGALLALGDAGAYGFAMSSQYNSRPRAAEALADGRALKLIRKRETFQDLVRNEL